jgi:hypothetical protein
MGASLPLRRFDPTYRAIIADDLMRDPDFPAFGFRRSR